MKKHLLLLLLSVYAFGQNPNPFPNGLKTTKIDTYASGVLPINGGVTVNSTSQAFVLPRMTTTQKNAISTPATSALVYDTTLGKYQYWNGSAWVDFGGGGGDSILQRVDQGNGDGIIIKGRDETYYGNVGEGALDLSFSDVISDNGATGFYSTAFGVANIASGDTSITGGVLNTASGEIATAFGVNNTASGVGSMVFGYGNTSSNEYSTAFGSENTASESYSTAFGNSNTASGQYSTAFGDDNTASGESATAFGNGNTANGYAETAMGLFGTEYIPSGAFPERIFNVGNGGGGTPSDAFQVWYNGLAKLPTATNAEITAATDDVIPTKGWVIANSGGGAVDSVNGQTGVVVLDADDISDTSTTNKWTNASEKATWNGKQATITGGATTITTSNLTANRALSSDASGKVVVSAVTKDEQGYLSGVTSAIQTQLNAKAPNGIVIKDVADKPSVVATTTQHVISSFPITGGTLVNGSVLEYMTRFDRVGTTVLSNVGIYISVNAGVVGSALPASTDLIAAVTIPATSNIPNFNRMFRLVGGNLVGFSASTSAATDAIITSNAQTITALNPATTYYLITTMSNTSGTDQMTQRYTLLNVK